MSRVATDLTEQVIALVAKTTPWDENFINNFEFKVPHTAFSSIYFPIITLITYCILFPSLGRFMANRESPPLKLILIIHNVSLCIMSGMLFAVMALKLLSYFEQGYTYLEIFCELNHKDQKGLLTLTYYLNYLLKYYELLDTLFLVLKKKQVGFLHAYHHPATLVLTWGQLVDNTGIQWVVISLNLIVHVCMYFYFALSAMNVEMPFKQLITILQIFQFILDVFACFGAYFMLMLQDTCYGRERAGVVGCFILTSYLFLFLDFYNETYSQSKPRKARSD